jgi:hypothetical protein
MQGGPTQCCEQIRRLHLAVNSNSINRIAVIYHGNVAIMYASCCAPCGRCFRVVRIDGVTPQREIWYWWFKCLKCYQRIANAKVWELGSVVIRGTEAFVCAPCLSGCGCVVVP